MPAGQSEFEAVVCMVGWWAVPTLREFGAKEGVAVLHQVFGAAAAGGDQIGDLIFAEANGRGGKAGSDKLAHALP